MEWSKRKPTYQNHFSIQSKQGYAVYYTLCRGYQFQKARDVKTDFGGGFVLEVLEG